MTSSAPTTGTTPITSTPPSGTTCTTSPTERPSSSSRPVQMDEIRPPPPEEDYESWLLYQPDSDDDHGGAQEFYTQSNVHHEDEGPHGQPVPQGQSVPHGQPVQPERPEPAPRQTEPAQEPLPGLNAVMVLRIGTGKCFHTEGCGMVRRAQGLEPHKVIRIRRGEARNSGLKPCGQCRP